MTEPYTPQYNKCDFCGKQIKDHEIPHLWRCLDKIGENFNRVRKAYSAFEKILENTK